MFNLKSANKNHLDQTDRIECLENNIHLMKSLKSAPIYRQKKFAIFGTKISESVNCSNDFLHSEHNERLDRIIEEQSPRATEILSRILQKNLCNYNQLINYNYKTKIKNHEDELKSNRLNFLLGMQQNEKVFSIRPASLNDLNERLGKIYSLKNYASNTRDSSSQTKVIYDLSKKQTPNGTRIKSFNSSSAESFKKTNNITEVLKKLALVDFSDHENQNEQQSSFT